VALDVGMTPAYNVSAWLADSSNGNHGNYPWVEDVFHMGSGMLPWSYVMETYKPAAGVYNVSTEPFLKGRAMGGEDKDGRILTITTIFCSTWTVSTHLTFSDLCHGFFSLFQSSDATFPNASQRSLPTPAMQYHV